MLNYVKGPRDAAETALLTADAKQGQWVYMDGEDISGEKVVTPVTTEAGAKKDRRILGVLMKPPVSVEGGDSLYEDIYVNDGDTTDDGLFATALFGAEHIVEDDQLVNRVAADFTTANYGDAMALTVSGYPTIDGATDDAGGPVVATFESKLGDVITYRTVMA